MSLSEAADWERVGLACDVVADSGGGFSTGRSCGMAKAAGGTMGAARGSTGRSDGSGGGLDVSAGGEEGTGRASTGGAASLGSIWTATSSGVVPSHGVSAVGLRGGDGGGGGGRSRAGGS